MQNIVTSDAVGSSSSAEYRIQEHEQLLLPQLDESTSAEALQEGRVCQEPWYLPICATSAVIFLSRISAGTLFRTKSLVTSGGALCAVVYTQKVTVTPCGGDGRNVALNIHKKMKDDHAGARLRGVSAGSVVLATNRSTSPSELTDHPFFALRQMWSLCSASETRSFTFRVTLALNLKGTCERRVVGGLWGLPPEKPKRKPRANFGNQGIKCRRKTWKSHKIKGNWKSLFKLLEIFFGGRFLKGCIFVGGWTSAGCFGVKVG